MKARYYKEFLKETNEGNTSEINEAKNVNFDDAFDAFDDSDFGPSYKSHTDIENFIDFLRSEYPKGTSFN